MSDIKDKLATAPAPLGQEEVRSPEYFFLLFVWSFPLKVDAAIASLLDRGCEVKAMVDQDGQEQAPDVQEAEVDTVAVAERVRYYLKSNQIQ